MKLRLNALFGALMATASGATLASAGAEPLSTLERRIETRTMFINADGNVAERHLRGDNEMIAQAVPGQVRKTIELRTIGDHAGHLALPDVDVLISNAMSEAFSNSASGLSSFSRTPVKNAPYSAEVISEKTQTLPDGNQISRRTSTLTYRDSAGRTRQEMRSDNGETRSIHINDSIEGVRYVLTPSTKSATRIALDKDFAKRIEDIRARTKAAAKTDGKVVIVERGHPGEEVVIKRVEVNGEGAQKEVREETTVNVIRVGGNVSVNTNGQNYSYKFGSDADHIGQALGGLGHSFQDARWSAKSTTSELGTRDFDGVRAEGKRRSYTIPAGEVGNRNPITVTSESWFSPDLQVTVYSKQSDPRSGDSIFRLANVKRTEQPLKLFGVPEGYAVRNSRSVATPEPLANPASK